MRLLVQQDHRLLHELLSHLTVEADLVGGMSKIKILVPGFTFISLLLYCLRIEDLMKYADAHL